MEHNIEVNKDRLLEKRNQILTRLGSLQKDQKRSAGPLSADYDEQAIETQNDEVVDALTGHERAEIQKINSALERMTNGTYGTCATCGTTIEQKRLKAVPEAVDCIQCAEERSA